MQVSKRESSFAKYANLSFVIIDAALLINSNNAIHMFPKLTMIFD